MRPDKFRPDMAGARSCSVYKRFPREGAEIYP
jgi:hypothetical protein